MLRGPEFFVIGSGEYCEAENECRGETFDIVKCTELLTG
jgi:hypothetical protein